ncbi:MAG: hypothetical protein LBN33_08100, partial [Desulfovibrio sp.]|nr:hypothetical protein [Desulfovibrio sp.]
DSGKAAEGISGESGGPEEVSAVSLDKAALLRLKEALEAEKIGLADKILKKLAAQALDPAVKTQLSAIADHMLIFEFNKAACLIDRFLEGCNRPQCKHGTENSISDRLEEQGPPAVS